MSQSVEGTSIMRSYTAYVVVKGQKNNIIPTVEYTFTLEYNTLDEPKEMAKYVARGNFLEQYPGYTVTRVSVNALILKGK